MVDAVASQPGIAESDAKKILDGLILAIMESVAKGDHISLDGFGKFKVKDSRRVMVAIKQPARPSVCRIMQADLHARQGG